MSLTQPRPSRSQPSDFRLQLATTAGRLVGLGSRLAGRGSGASIQGQVMLRIDPSALAKLIKGRRVGIVTGTNGKTTTTHLFAAAMRAALGAKDSRLITNADGANLHYGLASALSTAPTADTAILETDERVVADVIRLGEPQVAIMLNLSRDQLDRHHEIKRLGSSWRNALSAAGSAAPTVIANAEDPLIVWAAQAAPRVVWIAPGGSWAADATLCPACGGLLQRNASGWDCAGCEMRQPAADYHLRQNRILHRSGQSWEPQLNVPGIFNVGNAAFALAAARELGASPETALAGMRTVQAPAGRYGRVSYGATSARLILAKNPAGWVEALRLAQTDKVILAIDSAVADGTDVSWLWDVEFEQLAGKQVIATGPRAKDLAVRLTYAEVQHQTIPELRRAVSGHQAPVDVLATYTAFQRLRRLADGFGKAKGRESR